jgi:hypothetical protein
MVLSLVVQFHSRLTSAAGPESSNGLPSDGEDGDDALLDGEDGRKASSGLASPMDEPRYRTGRGRGRGGGRGRGSRRRKADADDDDASDIFDDSKAPNKRRKRGEPFPNFESVSDAPRKHPGDIGLTVSTLAHWRMD